MVRLLRYLQRQMSKVIYVLLHGILMLLSAERANALFDSVMRTFKKISHKMFFDIDAGPLIPLCGGKLFLVRAYGYSLILPRDDSLFYVREAEEVYLRPSPGNVVIDVGSHYGIYAMLASRIVGKSGQVIAFEPNPANFQGLLRNIWLNGSNNTKAVNVALGNFSGVAKLYLWHDTGGHSIVFKRKNWVLVEERKLDEMVSALGLVSTKGMLIKIDVEGAELAVIEGAIDTIRSFRPKLTVAAYHYDDEVEEIILYLRRNAPFYYVQTKGQFLNAIPCSNLSFS